jgi:hypothetical protein
MTTTPLYYKETLFDANRDLMVDHLVSEGGTAAEIARDMIDNAWAVWTSRLCMDNLGLTEERAQRIVNEAIGFLYFAGLTSESHGPSREVDLGWHIMLSDTRVYAALCQVVAGRFIHHDASDLLGPDTAADDETKCDTTCGNECRSGGPTRERRPLRETVAAMRKIGPIDAELWPVAVELEAA